MIPPSPHATVVSLPTLADVEGYERKDQAVWRHIQAGYPRFVRNYLVAQAAAHAAQDLKRTGELFPLVSRRAAEKLLAWSGITGVTIDAVGDWVLVTTSAGPSAAKLGKLIQHTGTLISSRQAEAYLQKKSPPGSGSIAIAEIQEACAPYFLTAPKADILISLSGMNAVAAAMDAVNAVQAPRGRTAWIQLGWLYVDSAKLFEKATHTQHEFVADVQDLAAVEKLLVKGNVAAVFTEAPNNPQLETADILALRKLCDRHGAKLILDSSSVGITILDLLPHADIVCSSLTKYAASKGDVMAGLLVVNPAKSDAEQLLKVARTELVPLHPLDAVVLASQIKQIGKVSQGLSHNAAELARRLSKHPAVVKVRTADTGPTADHFKALQRPGVGAGCLITVELKGEMRPVYDKIDLVKGPSFGVEFTIASPFLWLAHFDEVTSPEGRASIRAAGLDPDLLRISVGLESVEEIWSAFASALKK
jgi:cystathionine gamma-synthase